MTAPLRIRELHVRRLAIPLRLRFEHAAAQRDTGDPIIVELHGEAPHAGVVGFGETLARAYVTGETTDSVIEDIAQFLGSHLLEFRADTFEEAVERCQELPALADGRIINAARAGVELALLDLAGQVFRRRLCDVPFVLGLAGLGPPGSLSTARYSGIAVGRSALKLNCLLRAQRLNALRDFKLKVAVPGWERRLELAHRVLGRDIERGRATLRVDANGAWTPEQARAALPLLERCGVEAIEQPLARSNDHELAALADQTRCDLIADESLLTLEDADRLLDECGVRVLNVRLAKVGGFLPALRMAQRALQRRRDVQLGCLVGETSILTAAEIAFLECVPQVRYVEGAFGGLLLRRDVVAQSLRFGFGGRIRARPGWGLGLRPDAARLADLTIGPPQIMRF